jgi:LmbE family N-acetylglucosaminyl deacetylase
LKVQEIHKQFIRASRRLILRKMASLGCKKNLLNNLKSVLIVAPHPDDEVLGCGGLLAECTDNGIRTDILFLTNGEASHKGCCVIPEKDVATMRRSQAVSSSKILSIPHERLHFLGSRDGELPCKDQDGFVSLSKEIAAWIEKTAPAAVLCPNPFEEWRDHVAAEELTRFAITILPKRPKLYYYCVWFWYSMPLVKARNINWQRAQLLDISKHFLLKRQAMSIYLDDLAPCENPWIGKLPSQFLSSFNWDKELFFEADIET